MERTDDRIVRRATYGTIPKAKTPLLPHVRMGGRGCHKGVRSRNQKGWALKGRTGFFLQVTLRFHELPG